MQTVFKLRPKADSDLVNIYIYSVEHWGSARAEAYIRDMYAAFQQLALSPALGRDYSHIAPNLRAFTIASHIVFYKPASYGVAIIRVLHHAVDVPRHV